MLKIKQDKIYCYDNTDILKNIPNIKNEEDLDNWERQHTALRMAELIKKGIKGNFDFNSLRAIHKFLFQDTYKWAGEIRKVEIIKDKTEIFCYYENILNAAKAIFVNLKDSNYLINQSKDSKIRALAELFGDINALHPFREGNGRTQREFIEEIAKVNGLGLNLMRLSRQEMINIGHDAFNCNYKPVEQVFNDNIIDLNNDEQFKCINMYCLDDVKDYFIDDLKHKKLTLKKN